MKRKILSFFVLVLNISVAFGQVNITFELNTTTISSIDSSGFFVAGGSGFGIPGDHQLTDPDGDGIYTITIQKEEGFSSHYIFLNGKCSDWSCKENISGLPCADPAKFNDRFLPPVLSDTTILACFATCEEDGNCEVVSDSVELTFHLNTSEIVVDPSGIFIAGGRHFGNPGEHRLLDEDGDGIYSTTIRKPKGFSSHYIFLNGNCRDWSCKEDLAGLSCGDPTAFNDRLVSSVQLDTTILACFGNCTKDGTCIEKNVDGLTIDKNLFRIRPTIVNDYINITFCENVIDQKKEMIVSNAAEEIFQITNIENESIHQVNTARYPSGIYFMTIKTENSMLRKKFVVQK